jgi:hypothetical protein
MLSKLTLAGLGIAAAIVLAPIASADVDMTGGNKHEPATVAGDHYPTYLQGTGGNPFTILTGPDCKAVNGTWVEGKGFVADPNGTDVAWVNHEDGKLYSAPFDDGLSSSSRAMLNRVNDAKQQKKEAAAAAPSAAE